METSIEKALEKKDYDVAFSLLQKYKHPLFSQIVRSVNGQMYDKDFTPVESDLVISDEDIYNLKQYAIEDIRYKRLLIYLSLIPNVLLILVSLVSIMNLITHGLNNENLFYSIVPLIGFYGTWVNIRKLVKSNYL